VIKNHRAPYTKLFSFLDARHITPQKAVTVCDLNILAPARFRKAVTVQNNQTRIDYIKESKFQKLKGKFKKEIKSLNI